MCFPCHSHHPLFLHHPFVPKPFVLPPYWLHQSLRSRAPPVAVSVKVVAEWWRQHRPGGGRFSVSSAQELDEKYGEVARALLDGSITAYVLCKKLSQREPPVYVSDGVATITVITTTLTLTPPPPLLLTFSTATTNTTPATAGASTSTHHC